MGRPREFDEEQVLDRAVQVFWTHGYEATSVAALEEATGLGRQSLYNAFGGKRELFLRSLDRYTSVHADRDFATYGRGLGAMEAFLTESVQSMSDNGLCCFLTKSLLEGPGEGDVVARCGADVDRVRARARLWLEQAADDGELRSGLDTEMAARLVATHLHGLSVAVAAGVSASPLVEGIRWLVSSFRSP